MLVTLTLKDAQVELKWERLQGPDPGPHPEQLGGPAVGGANATGRPAPTHAQKSEEPLILAALLFSYSFTYSFTSAGQDSQLDRFLHARCNRRRRWRRALVQHPEQGKVVQVDPMRPVLKAPGTPDVSS